MKILNSIQIELILKFFENEEYAGWQNIAIHLINTGSCIVAKHDEKIWIAGIGNFIKESIAPENYIDCIQLNFNLKEFLQSKYFSESLTGHLNSIEYKTANLNAELNILNLKHKLFKELLNY